MTRYIVEVTAPSMVCGCPFGPGTGLEAPFDDDD